MCTRTLAASTRTTASGRSGVAHPGTWTCPSSPPGRRPSLSAKASARRTTPLASLRAGCAPSETPLRPATVPRCSAAPAQRVPAPPAPRNATASKTSTTLLIHQYSPTVTARLLLILTLAIHYLVYFNVNFYDTNIAHIIMQFYVFIIAVL